MSLRITHPQKGRLDISLSNTFGTSSQLAASHNDVTAYPAAGWTFTTVRHWGEKVNQKWTLTIANTYNLAGTFNDVTITFHGHNRQGVPK